jgi:hypothetical protein
MNKNLECLLACMIMVIVNRSSKYVALNGTYTNVNEKPLYDILNGYTAIISEKYADILMTLTLIYFIVRWLFIDISIITTYLLIATTVLLLRLISFNLTTIPPVLQKYASSGKDYMFSGHISVMVIITVLTFLHSKSNIEKYIMGILTIAEIYFLIASRMHYSVDIYIGIIISSLVSVFLNNYLIKDRIDTPINNPNEL